MDHEVESWYLNKAVYLFGTTFDDDIEQASKSTGKKPDSEMQTKLKRERRIAMWLNDGVDKPAGSGFRDPAAEMQKG